MDGNTVAMALLGALAYVIVGFAQRYIQGVPFDLKKASVAVAAALVLALVAPELIPADPGAVDQLPLILFGAFATFGAIYFVQKILAALLALLQLVRDNVGTFLAEPPAKRKSVPLRNAPRRR